MSGFDIGLAVCTYKRPDGLRKLLNALAEGLGRSDVAILIVDNDGQDPSLAEIATEAVQAHGLNISVFVESNPGISAARNRALDEADRMGLQSLAMLDDDEWPCSGWLDAMIACQRDTGADIVGGIVAPEFPVDRAYLKEYAQFWSVTPQMRDGKPFVHATSNILMNLSALRNMGSPRFDMDHGLSGGGDLVFFSKLFDVGATMAWTTDGVAMEEVPRNRASLDWMRARRFRVGNHMVMDEELRQGPFKPTLKTLGLGLRLLVYPLLGREKGARMTGWSLEFQKLRGRIAAHFGNRVFEYARDGVGLRRVTPVERSN